MKAFLSLPAFLTAAALLWGEISAISAPDAAQAVADDALPLEKIEERVRQINDDLTRRMDAFLAVVDGEAAAKRISDTVADLLRVLTKPARFDLNELNKNIPQKNEAILAASKELEAASRLLQIRMNAVAGGLTKALRQRMNEG